MKNIRRFAAGAMALLMAAAMPAYASSETTAAETTAAETTTVETTAAETTEAETTTVETTAAETTAAGTESTGDSGAEKIFRMAYSTPPTTLDPSKGNSTGDNEVQRALTEGLVRTINGKVTEGCAESWDVSDDLLTYTFHLRDGLKWSDGRELTSQDFLYGFQRLVNPETASPYAWILSTAGIQNADECMSGDKKPEELGVSAPDDSTFVITLSNPTPYLLSVLGSCTELNPIRQDYVEEYGTDYAATAEKNVYCGPFVLTKAGEDEYVYEKNPDYWNPDAVHFDKVIASVVPDRNTQVAMYESGDIDFVNLPLDQVSVYRDTPGENGYENGNVGFIYMNSSSEEQPLMQDKNFRMALNYAIDRDQFISLASDDVYKPATSLVLPDIAGAEKTYGEEYGDKLHKFSETADPDKAKECLQEAMDAAGIKDPSEITLKYTCPDSEDDKKQAEVIQQMWTENLGINVEIEQHTFAELFSNIYPKHDYEIGYGNWSPDYDDPYTYLELFRGDNPNNYSDYHNDEFDEKLKTTVTETDPVRRMDTLCECENLLLDDVAVIPTYIAVQHYMMNEKVTGINFSLGAVNFDWSFGDISE